MHNHVFESALKLYVDLISKYYKDSDFIPISNLFERPNLYNVLFPKLYKDHIKVNEGDILLVNGKVEKRFDKYQVVVSKIEEMKI